MIYLYIYIDINMHYHYPARNIDRYFLLKKSYILLGFVLAEVGQAHLHCRKASLVTSKKMLNATNTKYILDNSHVHKCRLSCQKRLFVGEATIQKPTQLYIGKSIIFNLIHFNFNFMQLKKQIGVSTTHK